ncbi:MAG: hypothetical protein Q4C47_00750 [Planctomycetia bacterium]|nr:hypothetical protein [Planctomycetia bacterium]
MKGTEKSGTEEMAWVGERCVVGGERENGMVQKDSVPENMTMNGEFSG